jgi:hypothetical protein
VTAPSWPQPGPPRRRAPNRVITPGRRLSLVIGAPICVIVLLATAFTYVSDLSSGHVRATLSVRPGAGAFSMRLVDEDLTVKPSTDGMVHLQGDVTYRLAAPTVNWGLSAASLQPHISCPTWTGGCSGTLVVEVPAGVALTIRNGVGDVHLSDLSMAVDLTSSVGDVDLSGLSGPVTVTDDIGNISGTDLRSPAVTAKGQNGDVSLAFSAVPSLVSAASDNGNILVRVPGTASYNVEAAANNGNRIQRLTSDPRSHHVIKADTINGNVLVTD